MHSAITPGETHPSAAIELYGEEFPKTQILISNTNPAAMPSLEESKLIAWGAFQACREGLFLSLILPYADALPCAVGTTGQAHPLRNFSDEPQ